MVLSSVTQTRSKNTKINTFSQGLVFSVFFWSQYRTQEISPTTCSKLSQHVVLRFILQPHVKVAMHSPLSYRATPRKGNETYCSPCFSGASPFVERPVRVDMLVSVILLVLVLKSGPASGAVSSAGAIYIDGSSAGAGVVAGVVAGAVSSASYIAGAGAGPDRTLAQPTGDHEMATASDRERVCRCALWTEEGQVHQPISAGRAP